jgi:chemotaxis protein histidine kinase CheA
MVLTREQPVMTAEAFRRQLEAISLDYRQGLPGTLRTLAALWQDLATGVAAPERLTDLQRELHTIAGTARTLGVAGVSEAAASADAFITPYSKRRRLPNAAKRAEFTRLLDALKRAAG